LARAKLTVVAVLIASGLLAACVPPSAPPATAAPGGAAGALVAAVNQDRAANGLAPLSWNQQLGGVAQHWANVMAFSSQLNHQDLPSLIRQFPGWHTMAENILCEPASLGPRALENVWMSSPLHRANILNPSLTRIGVGLTNDAQGRVWAVEDFGG